MDYTDTFSLVVRLETICAALALAVNLDWEIEQMDVKGAFLNGLLREDVYMRQPDGYSDGTNHVCRLIKTLYGLKQAGREWNKVLDTKMAKRGFMCLEADPCAYIRETHEHTELVTVWVDDLLLFANTPDVMKALKDELKSVFEVTDLGSPQKIVGIEIDHNRAEGKLKISQAQYIENLLAKYGMTEAHTVSTPMDPSVNLDEVPEGPVDMHIKEEYLSLIGLLLFLAIVTRPDIANAVQKLSAYMSNPAQCHWIAAKWVLCYLKGTKDIGIIYRKDENFNRATAFEAYSDASFNSKKDGKSITGYAFLCTGSAISWGS